MKITQMNDKVIITYINLKKGKVHISIELTFKKKKGKNLIALALTILQK